MEQLIARHQCRADSGRSVTVLEFQDRIDTSSFDGPSSIDGMRRFALQDGSTVNYVDAQTFKIVQGDELVRKL